MTLSPKRKCDGDGEGAASSGSASLHAAQARIEGVAAQVVEAARKTALEEAEVQTAARTLASHALRTEEELQWQAQRAATELAWRETSARNSVLNAEAAAEQQALGQQHVLDERTRAISNEMLRVQWEAQESVRAAQEQARLAQQQAMAAMEEAKQIKFQAEATLNMVRQQAQQAAQQAANIPVPPGRATPTGPAEPINNEGGDEEDDAYFEHGDSSGSESSGEDDANDHSQQPPTGPSPSMITGRSEKRRELDEIKGIPQWPTTAQFAAWKREVRYCVCAASTEPAEALKFVMAAEQWNGDPLKLSASAGVFTTLSIKWGKALRAIVRGEHKRELAIMEEKLVRQHGLLLTGPVIYNWVCRKFERDAQTARAQVLQELQVVKYVAGKTSLRSWKNSWDGVIEKLIQSGGEKDGDKELLYVCFKDSFMVVPELQEHAAKLRRSSQTSRVNTYAWMYKTVEAVLERQRQDTQEQERFRASLPAAPDPITPGVPTPSKKTEPKGKGKGKKDTKNQPCPRLSKGMTCKFGKDCYYSHDDAILKDAKNEKTKLCKFFQQGHCKKGDECTWSHSQKEEAKPSAVGVVCVPCLAAVSAPALDDVPDEHLRNNHQPPLRDSCPICRQCYLQKAPAKANPHPEGDQRLVANAFGDVIHMDTLFLTRGDNGVDEGSEDAKTEMGITMKDEATKDIEFVIVSNRTTREAKRALIHYGGGLGTLKKYDP